MATVPGDKSTKDAINQWNLEMRQQPWYQDWFHAQGLDANHVKLSKQQREQLEQLAIANGAPSDAFDDMMIDPAGNLNTEHGFASLPTWAKVAIGAGAVAGGFFAAPAVGGALGIGGSSAPAGITATATGSAGVGAGAGAGSTAALAGAAGTGLSTMGKIGGLLRAGAGAVGSATEASAQKQALGAQQELATNQQNIAGESAFQSQQQNMAQLEAAQQEAARKNLYRASVMKNPTVSPENRSGAPSFSPEMLEGMTNLEKAALARTGTTQYSTAQMRAPRDYQPLDVKSLSQPSTMQTIGNWLAPGLSIADMAFKAYGR